MTTASLQSIRNTEPWTVDALCAQVDVGDCFYPDQGNSGGDAKKVCAACPVREACLEYALSHDEKYGIWGGMSEKERRALRRGTLRQGKCRNGHDIARVGVNNSGRCCQCAADNNRRAVERRRQQGVRVAEHGTRARYMKGCHCQPCTQANSEYSRRARDRRRDEAERRFWHEVQRRIDAT